MHYDVIRAGVSVLHTPERVTGSGEQFVPIHKTSVALRRSGLSKTPRGAFESNYKTFSSCIEQFCPVRLEVMLERPRSA